MHNAFRTTVCLMALAVSAACAPKGPAPAEMVAAADAVDQKFLDAFNKPDLDALMTTWWNNADVVSIGLDGKPVKGFEAVKGGYDGTLKGLHGAKLEFTDRHNIASGDLVLGYGTWKATIPTEKGPPTVMEGRYSDVKAFRDGKWVYVMDHGSVPLPPAPAAPAAKKK